jgi:hypothetical protein
MFENRPTQIAGVLYLLFVVLFIVLIGLHTDYWKPLLLILLFTMPYVFISLYDIDCVFNGQCNVWGWIKGIFFIVYIVFTLVLTILLLVDFQNTVDSSIISSSTEDEDEEDEDNILVTYYDPSRGIDPGGNGTYSNSNISSSNLNARYLDKTNKQLYLNRRSVYGYY